MVKDDKLLEKYKEIWGKLSSSMKKELHSETECNEKYLKTELRFYERNINTSFHSVKVSKEGSQSICLSVILIDSAFGTGKIYYPCF